jgi:hypothetical protein
MGWGPYGSFEQGALIAGLREPGQFVTALGHGQGGDGGVEGVFGTGHGLFEGGIDRPG